jgi:hypothetical protein
VVRSQTLESLGVWMATVRTTTIRSDMWYVAPWLGYLRQFIYLYLSIPIFKLHFVNNTIYSEKQRLSDKDDYTLAFSPVCIIVSLFFSFFLLATTVVSCFKFRRMELTWRSWDQRAIPKKGSRRPQIPLF